ncbi:MAG: hypothetical protein IKC81_07730, partial [Paludibacteraceae bacterium]|nr:hypothetical protein [Paludibacteraceae bacterium]
KESFDLWLQQKSRHLSTSNYYRWSNKLFIGIELLSRLGFYGLLIATACLCYPFGLAVAGLVFLLRNVVQVSVINATAKQLGEKKFYFGVTLLDILLPLINLFLHIKRLFTPKMVYKWK